MSVQETQNIDDYTIPEIAELFGLNQPYTESKLSTQFIAFLQQHKNIDDAHMIFLKDAYMKLKNYIEEQEHDDNNVENEIIPNEGLEYLNGSHNIQEIPETIVGDESSIKYNPTQQIIQNNHPVDINYSNLNPLQRKTITKLVNIDSIFRENSNIVKSNDFLYNFKEDMKNVVSYKIASLELPNIWNIYSSELRNNEFTITVYNYSSGQRDPSNSDLSTNIIYIPETTHQLTIPEGNHGVGDIICIINNMFLTIENGLDFLLFAVDGGTGKCIFRCKNINDVEYTSSPKAFQGDATTNVFYSPNFAFKINFDLQEDQDLRKQQIELINNNSSCIQDLSGTDLTLYNTQLRPLYHNLGYLFGFQQNEYYVDYSNNITYNYIESNVITYYGILVSEGYYGDSLNKYIFIKIDDFNKNTHNSIISPTTENLITDNIIAKIPVDVGTFSMLNSNNSDRILKERVFFGPVNIRKMRIQLTDRFDRFIDIGFSNYSLTLEFKMLYS